MSENGGNGFVAGLLLGGIIGAVVGILIAPKEGSQTRSELLVQTSNLRSQVEGVAANVRENVSPAIDTAISAGCLPLIPLKPIGKTTVSICCCE